MDLKHGLAQRILHGFDKFYNEFKGFSISAKIAFEVEDYPAVLTASYERLSMYSVTMAQISKKIAEEFPIESKTEELWTGIEEIYRSLTSNRYEADLALAYMYSIRRAIVRSEWKAVNYVVGGTHKGDGHTIPRVFKTFKTREISSQIVLQIFSVAQLSAPFANPESDAEIVSSRITNIFEKNGKSKDIQRVDVLQAGFFRNRGAYIVSRVMLTNQTITPLVIALLNSSDGIYVDAVIVTIPDTHNLFSSTLANFHVSNKYYHEVCNFLSTIMPDRPLGLIYSTIGYNHFGKIAVMRELQFELSNMKSILDVAIGFEGTVAIGFHSKKSAYNLKVIRDQPTDRYKWGVFEGIDSVLEKYRRVHQINRTGSMLDNIIYYNVKLRRDWFNPVLLQNLLDSASDSVVSNDDEILFKHLIVQRRVTPLPVYLDSATQDDKEAVMVNLGHCIKNNTAANIFNKDLDARNYGVSQYQKVYLFDYDALELFTDIKIRTNMGRIDGEEDIPEWFFESGAIFLPEEIVSGLRILDSTSRKMFREAHADLMDASYWRRIQSQLLSGHVPEVRVYNEDNAIT